MENKETVINKNCPCVKKECPRFGKCAECREHHSHPGRQLIYCERKPVQKD